MLICGLAVKRADARAIHEDLLVRSESGRGGWIVTLNLEMLSRGVRDPAYRALLSQADECIADGMPLVWASRLGRHSGSGGIAGRTTGVDLVERILGAAEIPPFVIIGGHHPRKALARFEGASEACRYLYDGGVDLSDRQVDEFATEIRRCRPRLVFLALGVPKQDQLALKLRALAPEPVYIGVGGTFEMLAPGGKRAPLWMRKSGLEWFYRLVSDPGRLWKRYLLSYPVGAWRLLKDTYLKPETS